MIFRVFLPFALGYYFSYGYRSINAVLHRDLSADLGITAATLGLLTSAYLISFAAFQVPLGMLLDRYGPRRVNAALLVIAAIGALGFSLGTTAHELLIARAVIGLGVSAALMASLKAFTLHFPIERLPMISGLLLGVGGLGAMTATSPVEAALAFTDWRGVFRWLAAGTLVVSALVFFTVPERRSEGEPESLRHLLAGLGEVLRSRFFQRIAFMSFAILGPSIALQGLWVAPWIQDNLGMARSTTAQVLFMMTGAMTVGFVVFGALAARGRAVMALLLASSLGSILALVPLAFGIQSGAILIWVVFNFLVTGGTLVYSALAQHFPKEMMGRVSTSVNMLAFAGAFATQYGYGAILDLWDPSDGRYPAAAHAAALWSLIALQVVAFLVLWRGERVARAALLSRS